MNLYCTYLTTYHGNKLPQFYIGSTSIKIIRTGYHGSVKSKLYKEIWNSEILNNPHLFKTKIISTHGTRKEALNKEKILQERLNVVKSSMYINQAIATVNGFFGMDVSGKNNPAYKRIYKPSKQSRDKLKETHKNNPRIWMISPIGNSQHILKSHFVDYYNQGWILGRGKLQRKSKSTKCLYSHCIICRKQIQVNNLTNHFKFKHY